MDILSELYPTPVSLIDRCLAGINWREIDSVLEPSAGKGNFADGIMEHAKAFRYENNVEIDCIEKNPDLQKILKGKEYPVICDDFLTFETFKRYNLIVMNPPFSNGEEHLLKALKLQEHGGSIVCILNAETIRNSYTNKRKELAVILKENGADIQFVQQAFEQAERSTSVEVAIVKVTLPAKDNTSFIIDSLREKHYKENQADDITNLEVNDYIRAIVNRYNLEVEAGVKLIEEYIAISPYILASARTAESHNKPILQLKIGDKDLSINQYVESVRMKYWDVLFRNEKFTQGMTSNQIKEYSSQVQELKKFDFSYYNIKEIQIKMVGNMVRGIEDCIIGLFDELTRVHFWYKECESNIHYYNGWATNKAWIINKKVIIPLSAFSNIWKKFQYSYTVLVKFRNIEKVLDYLGGKSQTNESTASILERAESMQQTKNISLRYFDVTFYKKGTCHIVFKDEEVLKKLNIFGSQQKGWLPPSYGRKSYKEMNPDEKEVIDDFEGKDSYENVYSNTDYYIYNPQNTIKIA